LTVAGSLLLWSFWLEMTGFFFIFCARHPPVRCFLSD
jgi:cytochrome c biogenesis factor